MNNKYLQAIAIFICMLIINLPIIMADAYSTTPVNPAPVAIGVLIVGVAIVLPAIMSYLIGAGLASSLAYAETVDLCTGTSSSQIDHNTKNTLEITISNTASPMIDFCFNTSHVKDFYCKSSTDYNFTIFACQYGCVAGACKQSANSCEQPSATGTLDGVVITGKNGVAGYRKAINDYTLISAITYFSTGKVCPSNVKIKQGSNYISFTTCEDYGTEGKQYCTYKFSENTGYALAGTYRVDLALFKIPTDQSTDIAPGSGGSYSIDDTIPQITVSTPQPDKEKTKFSFKITDPAPSSGIGEFRIYSNGALIDAIVVNSSSNENTSTFSSVITPTILNTIQDTTITIKATDRVGNEGQGRSESFKLDKKAPSIVLGTVYMKRVVNNGITNVLTEDIHNIPGTGLLDVIIGAYIQSDNQDLDTTILKAKISSLHTSYSADASVALTCGTPSADGIYNCAFRTPINNKATNLNTVIVEGSDISGNNFSSSIGNYPIGVESSAPIYIQNSLKILNNKSEEIRFIPGTFNEKVTITLNLTDNDPGLNKDTVFADLYNLTDKQLTEKTKATACNKVISKFEQFSGEPKEWYYNCTWSEVQLKLNKSISYLYFVLSDLYNNGADTQVRIPVTINVDSSAPEITEFGTGHNYSDKEYVGPNDVLYAKITEVGSGINSSNISFNLDNQIIPALNCTITRNVEYYCFTNVTTFSTSLIQQPTLSLTVTDLTGNSITVSKTLELDKEKPKIEFITVMPPESTRISITQNASVGYLESGSGFKIIANISDKTMPVGTVDLSVFNMQSTGNVPGPKASTADSCTLNETTSLTNYWICEWNIGEVYRLNFSNTLNFTFQDIVKNNATLSKTVYMYGTDAVIPPDNFVVKDITSDDVEPSTFSRLTITLLNYPFSVKFQLLKNPLSSIDPNNIFIINQKVTNCRAGNGTDTINLLAVPSQPYESADLVIRANMTVGKENRAYFELKQFTSNFSNSITDFNIICDLETYQMFGGKVYELPEVDNLTIPIILRSSAVGGLPEEVINEINSRRGTWINDLTKTIDTINKIIKIVKAICTAIQTIIGLDSLAGTLKTFGTTLISLANVPVLSWLKPIGDGCNTVGEKIKEITGKIEKALYHNEDGKDSLLKKVCDFLACTNSKKISDKIISALDPTKNDSILGGGLGDSLSKGLAGFSNITSGATCTSGFCDWTSDVWSFDMSSAVKNTFDPYGSVIFSLATGCVPGIIAGYEKMEAIECKYINCLREQGKVGGDIRVCQEGEQVAWCSAVIGEIFEVLGISRLMKQISSYLTSYLTSIVSKLFTKVYSKMCIQLGKAGKNTVGYWAHVLICAIPDSIMSGVEVYKGVMGLADTWQSTVKSFTELSQNVCEEAMCDGEWQLTEVKKFGAAWQEGECKCTTDNQCYNGKCKDGICDFGWAYT